MPSNPLEKARARYVVPIDPIVLAVKCAGAYAMMTPPSDATPHQAFFGMEPESQDAWLRVANAALKFWGDQIQAANRSN